MKKQFDDWGTGLGEDPDRKEPAPKQMRQDSRGSLVHFFRDSLPTENLMRITAPVNGPAMMKGFKKLADRGFTNEQIREMILDFVKEITRRPLPVEVAPWRAFLANLDKYAKQQRTIKDVEPTTTSIDPRLIGD
jgi:hypothetical protein